MINVMEVQQSKSAATCVIPSCQYGPKSKECFNTMPRRIKAVLEAKVRVYWSIFTFASEKKVLL